MKGSVGAQKWLVHAFLTILVRTIIDVPNPSDGAFDFFHDPSRSSTTSHYVDAINACGVSSSAHPRPAVSLGR